MLFGAAKNGKSFVAISIACAVTAGVPWCGFPARKLRVLYVGAEGFFGLLRREAAWSKVHGVAVELQYFRRPINFFDIASVTAALAAVVPAVFSDAGTTVKFAQTGDVYEEARYRLARALGSSAP